MSDKPTLVQGAFGVRGRYETISEIPADETPLGTGWIHLAHHHVLHNMGYDRCRIKVWIPHRQHYITV